MLQRPNEPKLDLVGEVLLKLAKWGCGDAERELRQKETDDFLTTAFSHVSWKLLRCNMPIENKERK